MRVLFASIGLIFVSFQATGAEPGEFIISYWCGPPAGGNYDAQYAEVAQQIRQIATILGKKISPAPGAAR